jgi:hypothetical protein
MLKEIPFEFTREQISQFATGNVRGLALAGITFCREHHLSPGEYWCHIGCQFAEGWDWVKSTDELLFGILGNLLSMGFEVLSVDGDEYEYTVKLTGWPSDEELFAFELTRAQTDDMWKVFLPITDRQAHDFAWQRDNEIVTITITRR